jgi:hypothetical protein
MLYLAGPRSSNGTVEFFFFGLFPLGSGVVTGFPGEGGEERCAYFEALFLVWMLPWLSTTCPKVLIFPHPNPFSPLPLSVFNPCLSMKTPMC